MPYFSGMAGEGMARPESFIQLKIEFKSLDVMACSFPSNNHSPGFCS
tara:strand:- start:8620 stop:8760 length:141 start_codon:yes stop_codon:yes gene_type:complete